jgi:hypothetical protein
MKLDTGIIVIVVTIVVFYARMIFLRQRKRKEALRQISIQQHAQKVRKGSKKVEEKPQPQIEDSGLSIEVANWPLVIAGILFILIGFVINDYSVKLLSLGTYWWIITTLGVVMIGFGTK